MLLYLLLLGSASAFICSSSVHDRRERIDARPSVIVAREIIYFMLFVPTMSSIPLHRTEYLRPSRRASRSASIFYSQIG
ncbi:MAG: hypothetical protein WB774_12250 [Xanthobacteraceae bacterium]